MKSWGVPLSVGTMALGGVLLAMAALRHTPARSVVEVRTRPAESKTVPAETEHLVAITGAVMRPGVYRIRPGDRTADLIEAAGGPTPDADLARVNLAQRLKDEDQVRIPALGEAAVGPPLVSNPRTVTPTVNAATTSNRATPRPAITPLASGVLNLNSATESQLEKLPGIGEARARKIVQSRVSEGPFLEPADLVSRKLVPASVLAQIQGMIEVR